MQAFFGFALGQISWMGCEKASRFVAAFACAWILRLRALRSAQDDGDGRKDDSRDDGKGEPRAIH